MKFLKVILALIAIILYGLLNYFVASTLSHSLVSLFGININYIINAIFIIGTVCTILIYGFHARNVGTIIGKVGIYAFGFFVISFFIIIITDAIAELVYIGHTIPKSFGLIQFVILILVFAYGRYNIRDVRIKNYEVKVNKKSNLDNLNIVLISDLHLGYFNDNKRFKKNVERINNLNPDIVVIAGDFFDQNFASLQNNEKTKKLIKK